MSSKIHKLKLAGAKILSQNQYIIVYKLNGVRGIFDINSNKILSKYCGSIHMLKHFIVFLNFGIDKNGKKSIKYEGYAYKNTSNDFLNSTRYIRKVVDGYDANNDNEIILIQEISLSGKTRYILVNSDGKFRYINKNFRNYKNEYHINIYKDEYYVAIRTGIVDYSVYKINKDTLELTKLSYGDE